jgi:hypothetical protein
MIPLSLAKDDLYHAIQIEYHTARILCHFGDWFHGLMPRNDIQTDRVREAFRVAEVMYKDLIRSEELHFRKPQLLPWNQNDFNDRYIQWMFCGSPRVATVILADMDLSINSIIYSLDGIIESLPRHPGRARHWDALLKKAQYFRELIDLIQTKAPAQSKNLL